ncbi:MAG: hypothetical protein U0572_12180 [Phycisphaerales bacterium]
MKTRTAPATTIGSRLRRAAGSLAVLALAGCAADEASRVDSPSPQGAAEIVAQEPDGSVEDAPPADRQTSSDAQPARTDGASPALVASYREAVQRQATRLKRLKFLDSRGVIEVRYADDGGQHFEQCDLRLYAVLPTKTALNLSKLGSKKIAWIGSDDENWWVFRLDQSPTTLEVHPMASDDRDAGLSVVSPRTILLLAGLTALPEERSATLSEDSGSVTVESPADATPRARWRLDAGTWLPSRIELLDKSGAVVATGELTDYATALADGLAPGDSPKVPQRIVVTRADGNGSVRMSLDRPSARSDGIKPRFFDLKELQILMRPEEVIWRTPSPVATTP